MLRLLDLKTWRKKGGCRLYLVAGKGRVGEVSFGRTVHDKGWVGYDTIVRPTAPDFSTLFLPNDWSFNRTR